MTTVVSPDEYSDLVNSKAIAPDALVVEFDRVLKGIHYLIRTYNSKSKVVYVRHATREDLRKCLDVDIPENGTPLLSASAGTVTTYRNELPEGWFRLQWMPPEGESSLRRNALSEKLKALEDDDSKTVSRFEQEDKNVLTRYVNWEDDYREDRRDYGAATLSDSLLDYKSVVYNSKARKSYNVQLTSATANTIAKFFVNKPTYSQKTVADLAQQKAAGSYGGDCYEMSGGGVLYNSLGATGVGTVKSLSARGKVAANEKVLNDALNDYYGSANSNIAFLDNKCIVVRYCVMGRSNQFFNRGDVVRGYVINPDFLCLRQREDGRTLVVELDGKSHNDDVGSGVDIFNDYFRDQALYRSGFDVIRVKTKGTTGIKGYRTIFLEDEGLHLSPNDAQFQRIVDAVQEWYDCAPSDVNYDIPAMEVVHLDNPGIKERLGDMVATPKLETATVRAPVGGALGDSNVPSLKNIPSDAIIVFDSTVYIHGEAAYVIDDYDMDALRSVVYAFVRNAPETKVPRWIRHAMRSSLESNSGEGFPHPIKFNSVKI